MLDKNGKLFGKINLIDFILILIVAAAVVFAAMKVVSSRNNTASVTPVRITFFCEEVPDYVANALKEGTSVLDSTENVTMGTVESFKVGDPLGYVTNTKGVVEEVERTGYKSVTITMLSNAELGQHGATIDKVLYAVGHSLTIYAGDAKMYLKISDIQPIT